jgi:hypothetical protein
MTRAFRDRPQKKSRLLRCRDAAVTMIAGVSPRGPASQGSIAVICGTLESTESRVREEGCHRLDGTVPGRVVFIALPTRLKMFLRRDAPRSDCRGLCRCSSRAGHTAYRLLAIALCSSRGAPED